MKQLSKLFTCKTMFCGTSSFHHNDSKENPSPPPKTSKKKSNRNKNPYSSRGLDKFTSVLSELEAKRDKIMSSAGAQGISMVRFMYSNSQDWIPIVVRIREDPNGNANDRIVAAGDDKKTEEVVPVAAEKKVEKKRILEGEDQLVWWKWRKSYFMPVMMVLILVCLAVFGRVFAICCTSIWWYLVPSFKGDEKMVKRRVGRKKEFVKRLSDKKMHELGSPKGCNLKKE